MREITVLGRQCRHPQSDAQADGRAVNNQERQKRSGRSHVYERTGLCEELEKEEVFVDVVEAGNKFLNWVLPARYQKIGFSINELSDWLHRKLGGSPDGWLTDGRLHEAMEAFVKQVYDNHARKQAEEKVNMLSDAEAKLLLLKLIDRIPDVGLSVLE